MQTLRSGLPGIGHHHRTNEPQVTEDLYQENYATFIEDKEIMEVQQARLAQSPNRPLVPIRSDVAVVKSRQALHRLIDAERRGIEAQFP